MAAPRVTYGFEYPSIEEWCENPYRSIWFQFDWKGFYSGFITSRCGFWILFNWFGAYRINRTSGVCFGWKKSTELKEGGFLFEHNWRLGKGVHVGD